MMNLPSLLRKYRYQQFHVEPRHYDPIKEDIANRTSRIKAELGLNEADDLDVGFSSQISGSFRKNMKHATGAVDQSSLIRLIIFIVLILFVSGFVYIGMEVFYLVLLYIPFYLWKKLRK